MRTNSLRLCIATCGLAVMLASACASDSTEETIVGSRTLQELTTDAMFVQSVAILVPFHTLVHNGEPRKLIVRGEDNLIAQIDVAETEVGKWKISAPAALVFEQHNDVELEIPYVDMVEIRIDSEHVEFADDPATIWKGNAAKN